jgi:nucleoside-diphosphate-sugar epimerase
MAVLVTGATGNVGGELVAALPAGGHAVRALVRGERPAGLPAQARAVRGDLNDPASLAEGLADAESVFLMPGYADLPGIAAQAKAAGVARIVLLSGNSACGKDDNAITAYLNRSEAAVRTAVSRTRFCGRSDSRPTRCAGSTSSTPVTSSANRSPPSRSPCSTRPTSAPWQPPR